MPQAGRALAASIFPSSRFDTTIKDIIPAPSGTIQRGGASTPIGYAMDNRMVIRPSGKCLTVATKCKSSAFGWRFLLRIAPSPVGPTVEELKVQVQTGERKQPGIDFNSQSSGQAKVRRNWAGGMPARSLNAFVKLPRLWYPQRRHTSKTE